LLVPWYTHTDRRVNYGTRKDRGKKKEKRKKEKGDNVRNVS